MNKLSRLFKEEYGATMVEYAIMAVLIAAACITIVGALGGEVQQLFSSFQEEYPK